MNGKVNIKMENIWLDISIISYYIFAQQMTFGDLFYNWLSLTQFASQFQAAVHSCGHPALVCGRLVRPFSRRQLYECESGRLLDMEPCLSVCYLQHLSMPASCDQHLNAGFRISRPGVQAGAPWPTQMHGNVSCLSLSLLIT